MLDDGPLPASEVYKRAAEAGIREHTLVRAKAEFGVDSVKLGRPGEPSHWVWFLPKDANIARRMPILGLGTLRGDLAPFDADGVEDESPSAGPNARTESL